jgi:hypothetical protein
MKNRSWKHASVRKDRHGERVMEQSRRQKPTAPKRAPVRFGEPVSISEASEGRGRISKAIDRFRKGK